VSQANGARKIKLYVIPGSHPCAAVEVALRRKGLPFAPVNLLPMLQVGLGPVLYGGSTVPGMRLDGERLVGSRTIMRRLDELAPDPPLLPADPPARERVLEAERWGDDVFQSVPRRILDAGFLIGPAAMESYVADAKLPLPRAMLRPALPLTAKLMAKRNHAQEGPVREDLAALAGQLDQIDAWIAEGLLGGDEPNAADLQIGSTIRLLQTIADIRPRIESRPAATLTRYFPAMVGEIPAGTLPAAWLASSSNDTSR
jgi:glutathione S-transferase